jgi:antitoxin component YwqK of YwqJK toxin-antitoxin module
MDELEYSSQDNTITREGKPFTGTAVSGTSNTKGLPFNNFFTSIFLGDSILLEVDNGNPELLEAYKNEKQFLEVEFTQENGDQFSTVKRFVESNGIFTSTKIAYECEFKNGRKHGKEIIRKYREKLGELDKEKVVRYKNGLKNGIETIYYSSGRNLLSDQKIRSKNKYKNGVLHGVSTFFYRDGQTVKATKQYDNGSLIDYKKVSMNGVLLEKLKNGSIDRITMNGLIKTEDENGLRVTATYKNGFKFGQSIKENLNGQVLEKAIFKDGTLNGPVKRWYNDGELAFTSEFIDGKQEGIALQYHRNGNKWKETHFDKGDTIKSHKRWYEDGTLAYEGEYLDDEKNGIHKSFHQNGNLLKSVSFSHAKPDGLTEIFYEDGKKWKTKNFIWKSDTLFMHYTSWYTNGNMAERYTEKNGLQTGLYERWYENGQKRLEVERKNGKKDGHYLNWEENGTLYKDTYYKKDREVQ